MLCQGCHLLGVQLDSQNAMDCDEKSHLPSLKPATIPTNVDISEPKGIAELRNKYQGRHVTVMANNSAGAFGGAVSCLSCEMLAVRSAAFDGNVA